MDISPGCMALMFFLIFFSCFQRVAGELQLASRVSLLGWLPLQTGEGLQISGYLEILAQLESKFIVIFLWPVSSSL